MISNYLKLFFSLGSRIEIKGKMQDYKIKFGTT